MWRNGGGVCHNAQMLYTIFSPHFYLRVRLIRALPNNPTDTSGSPYALYRFVRCRAHNSIHFVSMRAIFTNCDVINKSVGYEDEYVGR